jgi:hypothetical protein
MKRTLLVLVMFISFVVSASTVKATVITFESLASTSNGLTFLPSYEESGYLFSVKTNLGAVTTFASPGSAAVSYYAGSAALTPSAANAITTLTRVDNGLFNFTSIDISEWFSNRSLDRNFTSWYKKTITGTLANGSHVSSIVTLDNIFGFQTFNLGSTFTDVISVSWTNNSAYYQFDNLIVNQSAPVPEPSSMILLGIGLAGFVICRKKFGV